jgi:hypothetical protein
MSGSHEKPSPDGAQTREKSTSFPFFEEGKKLAETGITSADGLRSLAFFTMADQKTVFGVNYMGADENPGVEFYFVNDIQLGEEERGIYILTARVNSDGEFAHAGKIAGEATVEGVMQQAVNEVFTMNVERDLTGDDGRIRAALRVAALKRRRSEIGRRSLVGKINIFNIGLEREMIEQRPSQKFRNLIQETLLLTDPVANNITPTPFSS